MLSSCQVTLLSNLSIWNPIFLFKNICPFSTFIFSLYKLLNSIHTREHWPHLCVSPLPPEDCLLSPVWPALQNSQPHPLHCFPILPPWWICALLQACASPTFTCTPLRKTYLFPVAHNPPVCSDLQTPRALCLAGSSTFLHSIPGPTHTSMPFCDREHTSS